MIEVRWHARAGQGAKTAAHLFALATLRTGRSAQAFPEYGPERRGAPVRAYTRIDDRPIRRHDSVTRPDAVVVLDPSLLAEPTVAEGIGPATLVLADADEDAPSLDGSRIVSVPAARLAEEAGTRFVNLVMAGALAAALGGPSVEAVEEAAVEVLGSKADGDAARAAVEEGYRWLS
ncbi:MAG TPA: 2-oxoacid:acceptor oxidoreductase family protein [Gaiellaceae bacterium]|nr:2-oxoacid:acceptor oxidoreductase family protein [Gaiellaceae bacterium]